MWDGLEVAGPGSLRRHLPPAALRSCTFGFARGAAEEPGPSRSPRGPRPPEGAAGGAWRCQCKQPEAARPPGPGPQPPGPGRAVLGAGRRRSGEAAGAAPRGSALFTQGVGRTWQPGCAGHSLSCVIASAVPRPSDRCAPYAACTGGKQQKSGVLFIIP